jgi:hypothetical protein
MELNFKPITIDDKDLITSYTFKSSYQNCDFAFANLCSWQFLYRSEYAIKDGFLFLRFYVDNNNENSNHQHLAYMFPLGEGDIDKAIELIEKDAGKMDFPLLILGVTTDIKNILNTSFPSGFTFFIERDYFDYIYLHDDLLNLTGKKFQPKRNHINKFKKLYDYTYMPVTPDLAPECMKLEEIWFEANISKEPNEDLLDERKSMCFALRHFNELGLLGGAIMIDGKIVAFTYGSRINNNTFGVHIEKADISYEGIFSVINQEFAQRIPGNYIFINREEDLGIPGLRKSKLSYNPAFLLEKNGAVKRR